MPGIPLWLVTIKMFKGGDNVCQNMICYRFKQQQQKQERGKESNDACHMENAQLNSGKNYDVENVTAHMKYLEIILLFFCFDSPYMNPI